MNARKTMWIALLVMLAVVLVPAAFTYAEGCECCECEVCCVLTQGFWKNHPEEWPVDSLEIGFVSYSKEDLINILKKPVKGNGLISLLHQFIAAKLNYAACGKQVCWLETALRNVDFLIEDKGGLYGYAPPKVTSYWTTFFSDFNEGRFGGWPSCDDGDKDGGDMAAPASAPTASSVFTFSVFK
ncbi:MAG: hypothetical protein QME75_07835 [Deltaproteobacteria bacterium]|nr:hypothetical protein [Deltaproteobacteria bacterium]